MLGEDNKFNVVAEFISAYWIASADEVSLAMTEGALSPPRLYLAILGILTKENWLL